MEEEEKSPSSEDIGNDGSFFRRYSEGLKSGLEKIRDYDLDLGFFNHDFDRYSISIAITIILLSIASIAIVFSVSPESSTDEAITLREAPEFQLQYYINISNSGLPVAIYECVPTESYLTPFRIGYECGLEGVHEEHEDVFSSRSSAKDADSGELSLEPVWKQQGEIVFSETNYAGAYNESGTVALTPKINITTPPGKGLYSLSMSAKKGWVILYNFDGTNVAQPINRSGEKKPASLQGVRVYEISELSAFEIQKTQHRFIRFEWIAIVILWISGLQLCLSIWQLKN